MLTSACLLFLPLVTGATQVRPPYISTHDVPWSKTGHPIDGEYQLQWDDKIDGELNRTDKKCRIKIKVLGEDVIGEFVGPIGGQDRKAVIIGKIEGGSDPTNLLTFRQKEPGYTCSYQLTLGTGEFMGTWHDTKGRRGDFLMLKFQ